MSRATSGADAKAERQPLGSSPVDLQPQARPRSRGQACASSPFLTAALGGQTLPVSPPSPSPSICSISKQSTLVTAQAALGEILKPGTQVVSSMSGAASMGDAKAVGQPLDSMPAQQLHPRPTSRGSACAPSPFLAAAFGGQTLQVKLPPPFTLCLPHFRSALFSGDCCALATQQEPIEEAVSANRALYLVHVAPFKPV